MVTNNIRKEIDECYRKMEHAINPATFELQDSYYKYEKRISELQSKCKHHFVNGKCEYCDLEEDE